MSITEANRLIPFDELRDKNRSDARSTKDSLERVYVPWYKKRHDGNTDKHQVLGKDILKPAIQWPYSKQSIPQDGGSRPSTKCPLCNRKFARPWTLRRHMRLFHSPDNREMSPASQVQRNLEETDERMADDIASISSSRRPKVVSRFDAILDSKPGSRTNVNSKIDSDSDDGDMQEDGDDEVIILTLKQIDRLLHLVAAAELGDVKLSKKSPLGFLNLDNYQRVSKDEDEDDDESDINYFETESVRAIKEVLFAAKLERLNLSDKLFTMLVESVDEAAEGD